MTQQAMARIKAVLNADAQREDEISQSIIESISVAQREPSNYQRITKLLDELEAYGLITVDTNFRSRMPATITTVLR